MSSDALVQYLASRKWRDFFVLHGPSTADAMTAKAFEASAKKFGARIVATKQFKVGTDPREREQNNPALLTAGRDYDVLFVADEAFEFARQVPYQTVRARPVVGAIDRAAGVALDLGAQRRAANKLTLPEADQRPPHGERRLGGMDRRQAGGEGRARDALGRLQGAARRSSSSAATFLMATRASP